MQSTITFLFQFRRPIFVLLWIFGCYATLRAQAVPVVSITPKPQIIVSGTLSLNASPATVSFVLTPGGVANSSNGITLTTSWTVVGLIDTLNVYGYFTNASQALSDSAPVPDYIPSSAVFGQVTGSNAVPTTFTAFTQTTPFEAGGGLMLVTSSSLVNLIGSSTNTLNLQINLTGKPNLPAGQYTGTLTLEAQMQ